MHVNATWFIEASRKTVWAVLSEFDYCRWWPEICEEMRIVSQEDPGVCNKVLDVVSRGWLSHHLRWRLDVSDAAPPRYLKVRASGDLVGDVVCTLEKDASWTIAHFEGSLATKGPWTKPFGFALDPLFSANVKWVMHQGELCIRREVDRRKASGQAAPMLLPHHNLFR